MKRTASLVAMTMGLVLTLIGWMPSSAVRSSAAEPAFTPATLPQSQPPGPIRLIPGLQSITFWERTGGPAPVANTFTVNSQQLEARLTSLDFANRDFTGGSLEFYDVFYSNAEGILNRDGGYVTVEADWNFALPTGGGLNIAEVQLNFAPASPVVFGNEVKSFVGLGDNFLPASVPNAVDGNLQTHTTMGNTVGQSQRLRITIGFPSAPATCTYSISPAGQTFSSDGGNGTISIAAPPGCEWHACVSFSVTRFIHITSASMGSGGGTISYKVDPATEEDPGPRSGAIHIDPSDAPTECDAFPDVKFTVTREKNGCPASAYSISSPSHKVVDGDAHSDLLIQVYAPPGCSWTASSGVSWINVLGVNGIASGTGDGQVGYTVEKNPGSWRGGVISVAGKVFTVYQNDKACPQEFVCVFFPQQCGNGGSSALATSRRFRDTVLAKTPRGRRYTQLYYRFAREAVQAMLLQPSLLLRSREIMQAYLPVVESIAKGEKPTLTRGDLEEIDGFLNAVAARGSPDFRETVKELCRELKDQQVHADVGITVIEGPKRELPGHEQLQSIRRISGMAILSGLCTLLIFAATGKRRKALSRHRRALLGVALAFTVVVGSGLDKPVVSGQPKSADSTSFITAPKTQLPSTKRYPKRPIAFESNQGQVDSQVKFVSRGHGYTMFLTPTEAVMKLTNRKSGVRSHNQTLSQPPVGRSPLSTGPATDPQRPAPDILRMKLVGANPNPAIQGLKQLPSVSNYYIGRDATKWRNDVPAYARVKYTGVYPGVDMVYYANRGELEYDLIVAPGADPQAIKQVFDGVEKIRLDERGDLVLSTAGGEIRQHKPVVYQEADGIKRIIAARYVLIQNQESELKTQLVGFEIGDYDATRPLTIDPVLAYSTYFGGSGTDEGNSIAVDTAGNVYVVGLTDSLNFPTMNNSQFNFGGGQQDAFVVKLDPSGTRVVYSTYLGGDDQDNGTGIAVDAAGNAYVTGYTGSSNFPVRNALQPTKAGAFNAFVVRLNPDGSMLNSTLLGGILSDYGSSIAVDSAGGIYVAGIASSPDFPTANAVQSAFGGSADVYVAKLNPAATQLVYSTYLGGAGIDGASSIAVDAAGNMYLTGLTSSPNFPLANPLQATHGGGIFDAFVMKLNPSGTLVLYSTYLGGTGVDRSFRIAVDAAGSAYVVGDTDSTNFPVANGPQQSNSGSSDAFAAKLSPSGNQFVYSTYLGGGGIDGGTALAVDSSGNAYVTGFTASTNFPTIKPIQQSIGGAYDGFVAKISSTGSILDYSTYFGGSGIDSGFGIAADASGSAYVMGVTSSTNFPTAAAFQQTFGGGTADLFIAKIKLAGPAIDRAEIQGKHLFVFGGGFDSGAKILLDGEVHPKTLNDEQNPTGMLFGKKAGKKIAGGQTITLQVRNPDGTLSNEFGFTRPAQ